MRARALVVAVILATAMGCDAPWASSEDDAPAQAGEVASTPESAPEDLAATGLYLDVAQKTLSPRVRSFAPAVELFSNGAEKERWIDLPDGQTIDASSADDWQLPVGTKAWKEFRVGGRRIETRFFWKVRADRWLSGAYVWSPDGTRATRGEGRTVDAGGAPYRVPSSDECNDCHRGRRDRLLGFEAIGLGLEGARGVTLASLVAEGRLSPPPPRTSIAVPDDGTGKAAPALAWMHVNCGVSCHDANPNATGYPIGLRLRLSYEDLTGARPPATWEALRSTIGVVAKNPDAPGDLRIAPGDPDASLLVARMSASGKARMPPVGATSVDPVGVAAVREWIAAMPRRPADVVSDDRALGRE